MSNGPDRELDLRRVSGGLRYTADVTAPNALHVAFVTSTQPHARILGIDTRAAQELAGVETVVTGADIGERRFGTGVKDYPVLAVDRVLFAGQRVAAVAATSVESARAAADLVEVDYEPLPPILDVNAAMNDEGEGLHPDGASYDGATEDHPVGNLQGWESVIDGDADAAFRVCDDVFEETYVFGRSHSAPLEPHSCLVDARDDLVEVWTSNKVPNRTREALAALTGRDADSIVVHPARIGGDFGSKSALYLEGICTLLSQRTGRPVRATLTYLELLTTTAARHPGHLRVRTGLKDGRLHVYEGESLLDGGAFAGIKPRKQHITSMVGHVMAPYELDVRDERAVALYSNNLPGGHVRSPGEFQAVFAGESHVDELARRLGEDPLDFRLRQACDPSVVRVLEDLKASTAGWGSAGDTGKGIAVYGCKAGGGQTTVSCKATATGVELRVGVPDQGSGMYDSFRRLAAEELHIPASHVVVTPVGADAHLVDAGAGSSRVTVVAGNATIDACQGLLRELHGPPPGTGRDDYWIANALESMGRSGCEVEGTFGHDGSASSAVPETVSGTAVEVSVDRTTGTFQVTRALIAVEIGRIANEVGFRGQLEGGFVYGLGQTLFEHLIVEDGQTVTASLGDYKLACIADIPPLEIHLLRPPGDAARRLGAAGELTNLGAAPAIGNAIADAVGVRLRHLPLRAEALWRSLRS